MLQHQAATSQDIPAMFLLGTECLGTSKHVQSLDVHNTAILCLSP
jgi:hypothetical protein